MPKAPERTAGPRYTLDRITAVPAVVGDASDFLIIGGLAGTAKDMAALTNDGANYYGLLCPLCQRRGARLRSACAALQLIDAQGRRQDEMDDG